MNRLCVGDMLRIQCYKHNKQVHRMWLEAVVLEEGKDYLICGNEKTVVIEASGNTWRTKEPAVMCFFKNKWFNVIAQLKSDGIYFYCNIATPYIIEDETIKYIDYDLDLRIFPNGEYKILDCLEYNYHKKVMGYSVELDKVIRTSLDELINLFKSKSDIFDENKIKKYYEQYIKVKNENLEYLG